MAEPTVWGFAAVANTSKSFPIEGTNLYGVDISGALVPKVVRLDANVHLLLTATKTDAQLVTALQEYIQRLGAGHEGAGGSPAQAAKQITLPLTTTT